MTAKKAVNPKARLNPILSARDRRVLVFLWRHRIATFQALRVIFCPDLSPEQAYYQLTRLRHGGFVRVEKLDGTNKVVWTLDARGFRYLLENFLPELKAKAYRPQRPFHDLLVASALLGRWAGGTPDGVEILTEQELSSTEAASLPLDLKKSLTHAPDGIWIFTGAEGCRGIALEVEITPKSTDRYEQICAFYTAQAFFRNVVWIVESKAHARRILAASRRFGMPREGVHLFIERDDFEQQEWDSVFLNESLRAVTLGQFLGTVAKVPVPRFSESGLKIDSRSTQGGLKTDVRNPFLEFTLSLGSTRRLEARRHKKIS